MAGFSPTANGNSLEQYQQLAKQLGGVQPYPDLAPSKGQSAPATPPANSAVQAPQQTPDFYAPELTPQAIAQGAKSANPWGSTSAIEDELKDAKTFNATLSDAVSKTIFDPDYNTQVQMDAVKYIPPNKTVSIVAGLASLLFGGSRVGTAASSFMQGAMQGAESNYTRAEAEAKANAAVDTANQDAQQKRSANMLSALERGQANYNNLLGRYDASAKWQVQDQTKRSIADAANQTRKEAIDKNLEGVQLRINSNQTINAANIASRIQIAQLGLEKALDVAHIGADAKMQASSLQFKAAVLREYTVADNAQLRFIGQKATGAYNTFSRAITAEANSTDDPATKQNKILGFIAQANQEIAGYSEEAGKIDKNVESVISGVDNGTKTGLDSYSVGMQNFAQSINSPYATPSATGYMPTRTSATSGTAGGATAPSSQGPSDMDKLMGMFIASQAQGGKQGAPTYNVIGGNGGITQEQLPGLVAQFETSRLESEATQVGLPKGITGAIQSELSANPKMTYADMVSDLSKHVKVTPEMQGALQRMYAFYAPNANFGNGQGPQPPAQGNNAQPGGGQSGKPWWEFGMFTGQNKPMTGTSATSGTPASFFGAGTNMSNMTYDQRVEATAKQLMPTDRPDLKPGTPQYQSALTQIESFEKLPVGSREKMAYDAAQDVARSVAGNAQQRAAIMANPNPYIAQAAQQMVLLQGNQGAGGFNVQAAQEMVRKYFKALGLAK
jgi:hypothetical protein